MSKWTKPSQSVRYSVTGWDEGKKQRVILYQTSRLLTAQGMGEHYSKQYQNIMILEAILILK